MKIVNLSRSKILSPRFLFIRFYYLGKFRHRLRRREFRLRESSLSRFVRIFLYFVIITFGKGRGIKISRAIYAINFFLFPSQLFREKERRASTFSPRRTKYIYRGAKLRGIVCKLAQKYDAWGSKQREVPREIPRNSGPRCLA